MKRMKGQKRQIFVNVLWDVTFPETQRNSPLVSVQERICLNDRWVLAFFSQLGLTHPGLDVYLLKGGVENPMHLGGGGTRL